MALLATHTKCWGARCVVYVPPSKQLGRLRQEALDCKASLCYIMSLRSA